MIARNWTANQFFPKVFLDQGFMGTFRQGGLREFIKRA
jgi:hypothetical protein